MGAADTSTFWAFLKVEVEMLATELQRGLCVYNGQWLRLPRLSSKQKTTLKAFGAKMVFLFINNLLTGEGQI